MELFPPAERYFLFYEIKASHLGSSEQGKDLANENKELILVWMGSPEFMNYNSTFNAIKLEFRTVQDPFRSEGHFLLEWIHGATKRITGGALSLLL